MIGIIIEDLGVSQLSYFAIRSMNALLQERPDLDGTIFYRQYAPLYTPAYFGVAGIDSLYSFNGTVVTTDLDGTELAVKYGLKPIFYVNDLEWIRGKNNFLNNIKTFDGTSGLYCRSESHAIAIREYCGKEPKIMPIFNVGEIIRG